LSLQWVLLDLWRVMTPKWFPLIWYQIPLVGQLIGGSNSTTMRRKLRGSSECGPYQNWLSAGSFVPSAHPQTHTCKYTKSHLYWNRRTQLKYRDGWVISLSAAVSCMRNKVWQHCQVQEM
jgi:hypothetical protein